MIKLNFVLIILLFIAFILVIKKRSFALLILFSLFIFCSFWRFISAAYIDFYGPVESVELFGAVGGTNGFFSYISLIFYIIPFLAILIVFNKTKIRKLLEHQRKSQFNTVKVGKIEIEKLIIFFSSIIIFLVYIELIIKGNIPFFTGEPRWIYSRHVAGFIFKIFVFIMGPLNWSLGYAWYSSLVKEKKIMSNAIIYLFLAEIIYLVLAGNKFTTPIYQMAIFMLSPSAILFRKNISIWINRQKKKIMIIFLLITCVLTGAMYKKYFVERAYSMKYFFSFFKQRVLIAPAQLSWSSFERIFICNEYDPMESIYLTVVNPLPMDANPSVNYLMYRTLGPKVLEMETGYTDAYPGIVVEIFGRYFSVILLVFISFLFAKVAYNLVSFTIRLRYFYALLFFFFTQALLMFFVQGQLLFLTSYRFYTKVLFVLILQFFSRTHIKSLNRYNYNKERCSNYN